MLVRLRRVVVPPVLLAAVLGAAACRGETTPKVSSGAARESPSVETVAADPAVSPSGEAPLDRPPPAGAAEPPPWLGTRVLPRGPDGFGIAKRTPKILRDRRLRTVDHLPPPAARRFVSSVGAVPREVLRRSTWQPACPVAKRDLAYVTVTFWGFDRRHHTGELIVHGSVARDIVAVFEKLHAARWPIEEMRVTRRSELDAPPTGDGNNTGAFVCRPARGSDEWSEHALGLALDVNPFHNPYVRDDLVLPELAGAYRDRTWKRPGMIRAGDVVTEAFAAIGWGWGGSWSSSKDWMHFSSSGR